MKYSVWIKSFLLGKTEVPITGTVNTLAIRGIRRFAEGNDKLWEVGITYTKRLVVR